MSGIPIFLSSDDNYAPFVATTVASICDNTKSFCDFYVLDSGISEENKEKICSLNNQYKNFSIEFINIDTDRDLKQIDYKNACSHVSISTYNRFLIPILKPALEKIIYLDVDIIVSGDIKTLYECNLEKYTLGAVPENEYNQKYKITLDLNSEHQYFNAGVLLINNKKFESSTLFETEKKYRDKLKWADQDVLNIAYENNYKILDKKFNFMTDEKECEDIIIRHFNTDVKPWHFDECLNTSYVSNLQCFWHYAKKTAFYNEIKKLVKYKTMAEFNKKRLLIIMGKRNNA